jgi:hypothetical protein
LVLFPVVKLLQIGAVLIIGFGFGVIVISMVFIRRPLQLYLFPISIDNRTRNNESQISLLLALGWTLI